MTSETSVATSPTISETRGQVISLKNEQFVEAARGLAQRTLAEVETTEARMVLMFRRATGRHPGSRELKILGDSLRGFLERYRTAPKDAEALVRYGEAMRPEGYDAAELAAWTMTASKALMTKASVPGRRET